MTKLTTIAVAILLAACSPKETIMITAHNSQQIAPALGPYSHAVSCKGAMVYLSGQIGLRADGTMIDGTVSEQTKQAFSNIANVLAEVGLDLSDVVKSTVFLVDMQDFSDMNTVYAQEFGEHRPARSTVQVSRLPKDALVEIEVIACQH